MLVLLLVFVSSFVYVAAKAFQQLNVVNDKYLWILPVSMLMAMLEVFNVGVIGYGAVHQSYLELILVGVSMGVGGAAGAILAMRLHKKI